ncbi:hypothetical protein C5C99_08960 [Rathayibacter sp. AY1C4]|uniref:hypothetical protein n=1 Tax=Rathayibacter sp. AY1C4 TaxID=2080537 RepID=UPI000CE806A0|nr:hypothetical protein [Rathayibacter sp. AY1C4]PPH20474.1 hypothetical protein C5C99_08960 [Rathayibacter sp. AY1C4]
MSNTQHEDKFIPSKQRNAFQRILASRVLPWFLVTIFATGVAGIITGWFLRSENMAQVNQPVASASLEQRQ